MLTKKNFAHTHKPCDHCPFRREGGIRLLRARIVEILGYVAPANGQGGTFPCHKTVDHDHRNQTTELQCAGALILMYKVGASTQFSRVMERLGVIDSDLCDGDHPEIFDDEDEMLAAALDAKVPTRRRRR